MKATLKKIAHSLGAALIYFGIYIAWQVAVVFAATFAVGFMVGLKYGLSIGDPDFAPASPEMLTADITNIIVKYSLHLTMIAAVLTLITYVIIFKVRGKKFFSEISLSPVSPGLCAVMLLFGMSSNILLAVVVGIIPFPEAWMTQYNEAISSIVETEFWTSLVFTAVLAPITEEVVFRGLVHSRLKRIMPAAAAMLLSSLIFGLVHGVAIQICYASLLGLLLVWVHERSGSLLAPIMFHVGFNACGVLIGYLENVILIVLLISVIVWVASLMLIIRYNRKSQPQIAGMCDSAKE